MIETIVMTLNPMNWNQAQTSMVVGILIGIAIGIGIGMNLAIAISKKAYRRPFNDIRNHVGNLKMEIADIKRRYGIR